MKHDRPPDHQARLAALTDPRCSLLAEAGAGSGKTSIVAGRVAVLLASGVHPKNVAAITFTEFAASELHIRIERFVDALFRGEFRVISRSRSRGRYRLRSEPILIERRMLSTRSSAPRSTASRRY